jgi:hypothetical protein
VAIGLQKASKICQAQAPVTANTREADQGKTALEECTGLSQVKTVQASNASHDIEILQNRSDLNES